MRFHSRSVFVVLCLILTAGCWVPETFTTSIHITKQHQYTFSYEGTMVFSEVLEKLQKGEHLSVQEDAALVKLVGDLRKDPHVTGAAYLGNGRARIILREEGQATPGTKFFMDLAEFQLAQNGGVRIVGMQKYDADARRALANGGVKLDGTIRLTSETDVLEHNAQSTPWFNGLFGSYKWHIDNKQFVVPTAVVR